MTSVGPLAASDVGRFLNRVRDIGLEQPPGGHAPAVPELAREWRTVGIRPGDVVLLALPNGLELLKQFFAVIASGGVPALVPPAMPSARLREQIEAIGARAVGAPHLHRDLPPFERHVRIEHTQVGVFPAAGAPAADDGEVILLTSGTAGAPSGCVFGFDALLRNATRHADAIGQRSTDTVLVSLPLHFSFALVAQALATLVRGGRLVVSGPPFHLPSYARAITEHAITVSSLTPVGARALLRAGRLAMPGLRVLTVGGDSLAPEQVAALLDRGLAPEIYLTYGLTQAGPRVSTLAAHREPAARHASVGLPLAGVRAWTEDLGDGTGRRQLVVASDTLMRRRIGRIEGRPPDWSAPGVLATGDIFESDADGYLFFRGRVADFIVRHGEKICLASVRRLASCLPGVLRARTVVYAREHGESDFDLELAVCDQAAVATDFKTALQRVLCRHEHPREIRARVEKGTEGKYK